MGLLKTAAKAHVATRVIGSTRRRQEQRWAAQDAAAQQAAIAAHQAAAHQAAVQHPQAPQPAVPAAVDMQSVVDQLRQLGELRDAGVLTPAEFEVQKQRVLAAGRP